MQIEPHESFMVTEIYAEINSISRWEFRIQPANSSVRLQVKVKVAQSCLTLCNPMGCMSMEHSGLETGQNTGVDSLSLLQGIFPTQGSNPGFPHCRQILYQLSHKGSPRILESVAYPFSRWSSQLRNQTGVSCFAGGFFTNWAMREAPVRLQNHG